MSCNICIEELTCGEIVCECSYTVCEDCMSKYLETIDDITCPSCHSPWTLDFIVKSVTSSFLNDQFYRWTFKQVKSLHVPNPIVLDYSTYLHNERIKCEIARKRNEMRMLVYEIEQLKSELIKIPQATNESYPCPAISCLGLVIKNRCLHCKAFMCSECGCIKLTDHECNNQDKISFQFFKDIKRCPWCRTGIERFQGCNDMVCTECGTRFNYDTLEISKSNSNHHYNQNVNVRKTNHMEEYNTLKNKLLEIDISSDISVVLDIVGLNQHKWTLAIDKIMRKNCKRYTYNSLIKYGCNTASNIVNEVYKDQNSLCDEDTKKLEISLEMLKFNISDLSSKLEVDNPFTN
jgi:hypothetical protein